MFTRNLILTGITACALGLSACNQESVPAQSSDFASPAPEQEQASSEALQPAAARWDMSAVPIDGAMLEVSPNPVDFCADKTAAVDVEWDVTAANPTTMQIWIESESGSGKLWIAPSTRQGTKRTGRWITDGSRIIAVDAGTNRALNLVTISALECVD